MQPTSVGFLLTEIWVADVSEEVKGNGRASLTALQQYRPSDRSDLFPAVRRVEMSGLDQALL